MRHLNTILLATPFLAALLSSGLAHANSSDNSNQDSNSSKKNQQFCQHEASCSPCASDDTSCSSVNGKRIDSGVSLGAKKSPPKNSERQLEQDSKKLIPWTEVKGIPQPEQEKVVKRTELKQVIDSSVAPKFVSGKSTLTPSLKQDLTMLLEQLRGKSGLKIKISGHTDSQRLSKRAAKIYGDNQGLGLARAKSTAAFLAQELNIPASQIETESYGPLRSLASNLTSAGMAKNRRVEISVSYDETVTVEEIIKVKQAPVIMAKPLRSCSDVLKTNIAAAPKPFRISIDGVELDETKNSKTTASKKTGTIDPDIQRCTDIALEKSAIQIRYDDLEMTPWLNISATPNSTVRKQKVTFNAYSNYNYWIKKRELRIFAADASTQSIPLQIIQLDSNGRAEWIPDADAPAQISYLLRVYDAEQRFDETAAKTLKIDAKAKPLTDIQSNEREELIGYGENHLQIHNIQVHGGAITVNGTDIDPSSKVTVMGQTIPVAANQRFATRQILPAGNHLIDVQLSNKTGTLNFSRNLYIPDQDWFYIGIADLIAGENKTSGPAQLVTGDEQHYDNDLYVDGRLAFYLKGKIKGEWLLTAAADTQEQPFDDLFSNFDSKDPRYLLRRLDPDLFYPVYGDDSTTVEDAPTRGKFYVKLARGDSHVMWGNFQTRWTGSDFANINRGMYGANAHIVSDTQTTYGEKQFEVDMFAGDPGTLGARDDFRATGGSLYYLRHQDITLGSESVWIEIRDKDTGIVLEAKQLTAAQDYDINSIQGRLLLTSPLPSTADDSQLVRAGSLSGHPVFLIASYEYTPGLAEADNMTVGGRASTWINDHVNIGATGYKQGDDATEQTLEEMDATLRYAAGTYIKGEIARSDGPGSGNNNSLTGGFEFDPVNGIDTEANAKRIEAAVDFSEISDAKGKASVYWQDREEGFSGPGQITTEDIRQTGVAVTTELTENLSIDTRADLKEAETQDTTTASVTGNYKLDSQWNVSVGVRYDDMETTVANASPTLSEDGSRTDLAAQIEYSPAPDKDGEEYEEDKEQEPDWSLYGFGQGTIQKADTRDNNDRFGIGGRYKINDSLGLTSELSGGNGGLGGKVGGDWRVNDRSHLYMNYALDTDRTDDLSRGRQGNFTTGGKTRYSDSLSVYAEERLQHGDGPSGLIHAFGLDLAALDTWNFGFKAEIGDLSDPNSGDVERTALSLSTGYVKEKTKYAGNLEWRKDDATESGERTTWLMRNSLGYQTTADWRFIGKLNFSFSDSEQGEFYDADFVEAVLGYAYRPVNNDKLNTLFKYTYFYDLPSTDTLTASESMADYAQRSHILSADATYDLYPWLSVGGKYGFRRGEVRDNRVDGTWFRSDAHLGIVRADWHFVHKWDALLEARILKVDEAEDERSGFLTAIYRHINSNFKIGAGYNFTDFSDDLTDLDYDSQGWFINLIGKF